MMKNIIYETIVTYPKADIVFWIYSSKSEIIKHLERFYVKVSREDLNDYNTIYPIYIIDDNILFAQQSITVHTTSNAISTINKIIRQNLKFKGAWIPYHGATLLVGGKVYMFLGSTGAGKTTLAVFLSQQRNIQLLSEDITILNWETKEIINQIYPICIRKESFDLLTSVYNCDLKCLEENYNGKYLYEYLHKQNTKHKYVLDKCFLLDRAEVCNEPKCCPVSSVMPYILNSYCNIDMIRNIRSAQSLNEKNMMYKLSYANLNLVYNFLKKL